MTPQLDIGAISPMILVAAGAVFLPLLEVMLSRRRTFLSRPVTREWIGTVMAVGSAFFLIAALIGTADGFWAAPRVFNPDNPMIALDGFSHFLNAVVLIGGLITVLLSIKFLADLEINHGEFYALILAAVMGMMFLTAATDLMMLFLALEMMSIPIYVLAGFRRSALRSNESALKYFLIGSFASGILLYGIALIYGATGALEVRVVADRFDPESPLAVLGAGLILIGLAFKVSSVPFHQWVPDVYEGAPSTVTGFMATTVKVAAFGALLRILGEALHPGAELFYGVLWVLAFLTMTVGNVMAIVQQNTKRMLAYSSIAHAGYLLIGVVTGTQTGYSAVLFYLLVYTFMTLGAFAVISVLARDGEERDRIDDLAGLSDRRPMLAAVMAICMFSLAGIPGTAGFMGKFYVFRGAIEHSIAIGASSLLWLAVLGVLNSAVSLVYYLRIPIAMYMRDPVGEEAPDAPGTFEGLVLSVCAAATLLLGIWPEHLNVIVTQLNLLHWATIATASLVP